LRKGPGIATTDVRAMLARRPAAAASAFGHVDVSLRGRTELAQIVTQIASTQVANKKPIVFHPEDRAEDGEVLTAPLAKFDRHFQPKAPWSLERAVAAIRASGLPRPLGANDITNGGWSFYAIRVRDSKRDLVAVRAKSPTFGLTAHNKLVTQLVGNELKPVDTPLISFDHSADLLVIDKRVYVINPQGAERLLVDADAVKARAPQTAKKFRQDLGAKLSNRTALAVQRVCSHNAFTARRVERLIGDGALQNVSAAEVRAALPEAGLPSNAFGLRGPLRAESDQQAKILIEIAADLYYQPRFAAGSRRVGSYRSVK
jgi:hypothetical protein